MSIVEFLNKYHDYQQHCKQGEGFNNNHPLHAEMLLVLQDLYKQRFPRRKFITEKVQKDLPEYDAIYKSFRDRAQVIYQEWFTAKQQLEYDLAVIAEKVTTQELQAYCADSEMNIVHVSSSYDYHTQGYGAASYARGEALRWQQKFEYYGLKTMLEEVTSTEHYVHGIAMRRYVLSANCAPAVAEIVRRKPEIPLRDWLKMCWKNGVNPRVYNPFLRYGLEEELNIDYFGNDLDPERKVAV